MRPSGEAKLWGGGVGIQPAGQAREVEPTSEKEQLRFGTARSEWVGDISSSGSITGGKCDNQAH